MKLIKIVIIKLKHANMPLSYLNFTIFALFLSGSACLLQLQILTRYHSENSSHKMMGCKCTLYYSKLTVCTVYDFHIIPPSPISYRVRMFDPVFKTLLITWSVCLGFMSGSNLVIKFLATSLMVILILPNSTNAFIYTHVIL